MTPEEIQKIHDMHSQGTPYRVIAKEMQYCDNHVWMIGSGYYEQFKAIQRRKYAERKAAAK